MKYNNINIPRLSDEFSLPRICRVCSVLFLYIYVVVVGHDVNKSKAKHYFFTRTKHQENMYVCMYEYYNQTGKPDL